MKSIRKLLTGTLAAVGALACVTATILVLNEYRSQPVDTANECHVTAWENLGANFDLDLPQVPDDSPGLARIADPNMADAAKTRDVIDEELRDASPEEREIWSDELAQHSPEEIREILGLHRRLALSQGHSRVGDVEFVAGLEPAPHPLSEAGRTSASRIPTDTLISADPPAATETSAAVEVPASADALGLIESAMETTSAAEQVILNNVANVNTVGFKRSRVLFGDLPYRQVALPGLVDQQGNPTPTGLALGAGVKLLATQADVSQGRLRHTQEPLDLAIQGDGYFQIHDGNRTLYTRAGSFTVNANGQIVLVSKDRGRRLEPAITIPQDTVKITISPQGIVSGFQSAQTQATQIGQIQLVRFMTPHGLLARGENLCEQSAASGNPLASTPGEDGSGEIQQGYLEEANVVIADELAELRRMQVQLKTLRQLHAEFSNPSRVP